MLDKQLALKLKALVGNQIIWEPLKEHLDNLKTLDLQALVVATSESEMFRLQGRLHSLHRLKELDLQVKEAINRKEEI
jgi:hypothetical protein